MGSAVDVTVTDAGVSGEATFVEARPDPAAKLGQPIRFSLVTSSGAVIPVSVRVQVVADHVVATRAIARGESLSVEDLTAVRREVVNVPLRPLPAVRDLTSRRALRPIAAGETVAASAAAVRRTVEPGDRVTVVASAGAVQVTAEFVAADGGRTGDVIRVVNPDSRRYVRGRVVREGVVEVINAR
jgi:flagella basal body P-ring formation protein FlgA